MPNIKRSLHMMTIDLPYGPELEVDICFTYDADSGELIFVAADPPQPFSGASAELQYERLQNLAHEWFDRYGHARALKQIEVDKEYE
jgi:hypothetical protein